MKDESKKMFLIFHGRFPSEKAASLFAAKSAESFAEQGVPVTLLVPRRISREKKAFYDYYDIQKNYKVVFLPVIDLFHIPIISIFAFHVSIITFSVSCFFYLIFRARKDSIIYSNETVPILLASFLFPRTLIEVHDFPEKKLFLYKMLFSRVKWILSTNKWKKGKLIQEFKVRDDKIFYEPNAVDVSRFDVSVSKEEAREKLELLLEKYIVVYTGHLYSWKGVDTLAQATRDLSDDIVVVLVGGVSTDVARFKAQYGSIENLKIVGHREHTEIPYWQKAADVLILPNTAKEDISKFYTSPMKLFEYMASKRPIIASKIPSIEELLDETNSILIEPDNPSVLATAIKEMINKKDVAEHISNTAFKNVQNFTWEARARRILAVIKKT
ncbi:glycosyltransferase family 4 protein [Candidatus Kaiserbacteria bacterium]|nr:glycosyltransferase family 4 protein [Candidatus Kaiserbacteria bacterium]